MNGLYYHLRVLISACGFGIVHNALFSRKRKTTHNVSLQVVNNWQVSNRLRRGLCKKGNSNRKGKRTRTREKEEKTEDRNKRQIYSGR